MQDDADALMFLRSALENHFRETKAPPAEQHSIRINNERRVCFAWTEDGPTHVEIVDYR